MKSKKAKMKKIIVLTLISLLSITTFAQNVFNQKKQSNKSLIEKGMYAKFKNT